MAQEAHTDQPTSQITVNMENFSHDQGSVLIVLYDEAGFMTEKNIQAGKASIKQGKSSYVFTNIPEGTYAIVALHDTNGNQRMDFDANGMPVEGWATSNNDMTMGPPSFEAAKFTLQEKDMELTLRF